MLKNDLENFEIDNAILSKTNLAIIVNTNYSLQSLISGITVSDEMENIYNIYKTVDDKKYKFIFNIDNALDKQLYLNLNLPEYNINKKIPFIKK